MEEDPINFEEGVHPHLCNMWLQTFWLDKPARWFVLTKSHFLIHNVKGEQARFDLLVSLLSKESVGLVLDIVEDPPQHKPLIGFWQASC
jgi:hypothetical protein